MEKTKAPAWPKWSHMPQYTADEAAAVSMNFCPHVVKEIQDEVLFSGSPELFGIVALTKGMDFDESEELQWRILLLSRQFDGMIPKVELIEFGQRVGWHFPFELTPSSARPSPLDVEPPLRDKGRTSLLKTIGLLAAQLAATPSNKGKYYHADREGKQDSQRIKISSIVEELLTRASGLPGGDGGLGATSLENRIKTGLELLEKK